MTNHILNHPQDWHLCIIWEKKRRKKNQFSSLHRSITMISYVQSFIFIYHRKSCTTSISCLWFVTHYYFSLSLILSFSSTLLFSQQLPNNHSSKILLIRCWLVTIASTWIHTHNVDTSVLQISFLRCFFFIRRIFTFSKLILDRSYFFFLDIKMGNTTTCSPKPPSPPKRTSPIYRLKTSSPLPTHIHHCKQQIYFQPFYSPSKYKGNLSIHVLFADIHWLTTNSRSDSQESSPITLFSFTWICLPMFVLIGLDI
jgi:hypothetical protein